MQTVGGGYRDWAQGYGLSNQDDGNDDPSFMGQFAAALGHTEHSRPIVDTRGGQMW